MSEETLKYLNENNISNFCEVSSKSRTRPGGFQDDITEDEIVYEKDGKYYRAIL